MNINNIDSELDKNHDFDVNEIKENIFNPFNPLNKEIKENNVNEILKLYGVNYKIDNISLYQRAFVHRSYIKQPNIENINRDIKIVDKPFDCLPLKSKSNERLEFIGDGVLELITKYYLYRRFPKADEGFMTEKKIAIVKNEHIGKLAYEMKLNKWYILSKHTEEKNTRTNFKKLGCLFEAFIGALFLDVNKISIKDEDNWFSNVFVTGPGFQMAQIFVENIFEKHIDWTNLINNDDNYKNKLQVLIQKDFKTTPYYLEIEHDSENRYIMGVYLCIGKEIHEINQKEAINFDEVKSFDNIKSIIEKNNYVFILLGKGCHKIKKKAEQIACEECFNKINNY